MSRRSTALGGTTGCRLLIAALAILLCAVPAAAKSYSAERFDTFIRVLPGGHIEVVETVVFRFESGTFEHVFREIPARRTDGIEILGASMDGRELPFGTGVGQVEVRRSGRVRVRWRFAPLSDSAHTFELKYLVRGVVRTLDDADVLHWRALPGEHAYAIDTSSIEFQLPGALTRAPEVNSQRVADARLERLGDRVRVTATGIRKNGWVEAALRFAPGTVADGPPRWQQRQIRAAALAPRWMAASGLVLVAGLALLVALRQRYDAPTDDISGSRAVPAAPGALPPGIAGAMAANGRVGLEHALATLFALADRGIVSIAEEPRGTFGQRSFVLRRYRSDRSLLPHEEAALAIAFSSEEATSLSKARSRLARKLKTFRAAVQQEMLADGLIDHDRKRLHDLYGAVAIALLLAGSAALIALAVLVNVYQGWALLPAAAILLTAVVAFVFQAATTPLANEGVRRRSEWRAYQAHLKEVARERAHLTTDTPARILPFVVALGLAGAWAKYVRKHPAASPEWFQALSTTTDNAGFAALLAGSSGGDGGGGASAGGAAGGGSSGAG